MTPTNNGIAGRFVGAWRYVGAWVDGKPRADQRGKPTGMIVYTASGEMAAQVAPGRATAMAGREPSGEEAKAALDGYVAYVGTYTIDEQAGTVTHHRAGNVQPGPLTDVVRGYTFRDDRLILKPVGTTQEIVWERIR